MRILICDDDELIRRQIQKFLCDYPKAKVLPRIPTSAASV